MQPDEKYTWLTEGLRSEFASFLPMGTKEAKTERAIHVHTMFRNYGGGVKTNRDEWVYDFNPSSLANKIRRSIDAYNGEIDRWRRRGSDTTSVDNFVTYDDTKIKWSRDLKLDLYRGHYATFSETKLRKSVYRPFCKRWLFFDRILNEEVYQFPQIFPTSSSELENQIICVSAIGSSKGIPPQVD